MDQNELLNYVADALNRHGIKYAITGSHASNVYGETRFTNDIDVVIELASHGLLKKLLTDFPQGIFYVSDIGAAQAVTSGGQFNIIHEDTSQKVDLIIPREAGWPDQLARRRKVSTQGGKEISFISAEDLILRKMDLYREGGSDKHLRDIAAMLRITGDQVDKIYITDWANALKLSGIWQKILESLDESKRK